MDLAYLDWQWCELSCFGGGWTCFLDLGGHPPPLDSEVSSSEHKVKSMTDAILSVAVFCISSLVVGSTLLEFPLFLQLASSTIYDGICSEELDVGV
jgi:hypothetical protein